MIMVMIMLQERGHQVQLIMVELEIEVEDFGGWEIKSVRIDGRNAGAFLRTF